MQAIWEMRVQSLGWEDPWRRKWQPAPVFFPGNSMDREAWQAPVHGVAKSRTWLRTQRKQLLNTVQIAEIQPINPKGNQPWAFTGRTDAEAETPVLWPPDAKSRLIRKDPDAGKDWRQEEKGMAEDEMVGWHHWLNGHEFEQAPGDGEGQGSLECCSPWGHKESDMTQQLNNSKKKLLSKRREVKKEEKKRKEGRLGSNVFTHQNVLKFPGGLVQ